MKETTIKETALGLIVILALGLLVLPRGAEAQQARKAVRIGILTTGAPPAADAPLHPLWDALRHALREQGWVEGQNLTLELRWAAGQYERFPALAA
jgi:putative ABC transport system substrate-binding protein